jgi:hypothetical protein
MRRRVFIALVGGAAACPVGVFSQSRERTFTNFQLIGCYRNVADKKLWLAAIALNEKFTKQDFYEDDSFFITVQAGASKFDIPGKDIVVNPMASFDYKPAETYQFMKYSLVVDYSSSIPVGVRTDVLNFLDKFVNRLPLAVEGQLIRFNDKVEKFPFTSNKADIQLQLRQPIDYSMTSLHDALMEAASSLIQQGSTTPVRVIVLFTDGFDTSSTTYKDRANFLSSFANLVKANRIAVLAVGVSNDQDHELLRSITDFSQGISGYYVRVDDFSKFEMAFKQVESMMRNTIIFRLPRFGPDHGKAQVSLATRSKAGNISTIQSFECEY